MNHTNLEMIYGNQAKPEIAQELRSCETCIYPGPVAIGSTAQQCNSCEGYCNYTAKETKMEDLQNIVVFTGCDEHQRMFGDCDDPTHKCIVGHKYVVEYREVHSWHTKIKLQGMVGLFNSVCFEDYTAKEETDNQKITKEDSVSTHKGAVDGSAPTTKNDANSEPLANAVIISTQLEEMVRLNKVIDGLTKQLADRDESLNRMAEALEHALGVMR